MKPICSICNNKLTKEEHEKESHDYWECLIDKFKCAKCHREEIEQQQYDDMRSYTMCGG
jgi:hypothetical protein